MEDKTKNTLEIESQLRHITKHRKVLRVLEGYITACLAPSGFFSWSTNPTLHFFLEPLQNHDYVTNPHPSAQQHEENVILQYIDNTATKK